MEATKFKIDDVERQLITVHQEKLSTLTIVDTKLLVKLVKRDVLTDEDVTNIRLIGMRAQAFHLYGIAKAKNNAFQVLVTALMETEQRDAYELLASLNRREGTDETFVEGGITEIKHEDSQPQVPKPNIRKNMAKDGWWRIADLVVGAGILIALSTNVYLMSQNSNVNDSPLLNQPNIDCGKIITTTIDSNLILMEQFESQNNTFDIISTKLSDIQKDISAGLQTCVDKIIQDEEGFASEKFTDQGPSEYVNTDPVLSELETFGRYYLMSLWYIKKGLNIALSVIVFCGIFLEELRRRKTKQGKDEKVDHYFHVIGFFTFLFLFLTVPVIIYCIIGAFLMHFSLTTWWSGVVHMFIFKIILYFEAQKRELKMFDSATKTIVFYAFVVFAVLDVFILCPFTALSYHTFSVKTITSAYI